MNFNWGLLQFGVFLSMFSALIAAECMWPRRTRSVELVSRWSANMGLTIVNMIAGTAANLIVPTIVMVQAINAESLGWGVLPAIGAPWWIAALVTIAALDLTLYSFHVACHKLPWLWSFHRMHHLDLDVDATTAFRGHPFEVISSHVLKIGVVYALGGPALAVLAYEIVINVFAMFSHSNVRLSEGLDRTMRRFLVTPDVHRIHHSTYQAETDSNYGVVTPLWDRMFGTYTGAPRDGQTEMKLGLEDVRGRETYNLAWLVAVPFISFERLKTKAPAAPVAVTTSLHTPA